MVVGFCLFVRFCILLSILRPNCTCMQLFLVPYSFFVFCCLRRHLSRCRRCSKGSQVPACLNRTLGLFPTSQPATHRLRWNLGGGQHDCVPNRQPKPQGFPSTCSFLSGQFERKQEMSSTSLCQHLPQLESKGLSFFFFLINLFISGCVGSSLLCGLSLAAASGGYSSMRCAGFSLWWLLLLRSTGSRRAGFSSCGTWAQ